MFLPKLFDFVSCILCLKLIPRCQTSTQQNETTIPLAQLLYELQRQPHPGLFNAHLTAMFNIASCGHRLYAVSKDVSPECSQTAVATSIMLKNLTMGFQVMELLESAMAYIDHQDLRTSIDLQEHPLETVCRKVEQYFGESPLNNFFENSKNKAADVTISSGPPYASTLITSQEALDSWEKEWYDHPEWAEWSVLMSYYVYLEGYMSDSEDLTLIFAESVLRVAKKEEFADSMQSLFLRAVKDVLPQITQSSSESRDEFFFWLEDFIKILYSHIAKDPILKNEVDNAAVIYSLGKTTLDKLDTSKKSIHSEL